MQEVFTMKYKNLQKKNLSQQERYNIINRFNRSPEFLEDFQTIMIERLLLNREEQYHPDNVKDILQNNKRQRFKRNSKDMNTDITGGLLLSTVVEADFYILLQEKVKELTGRYIPMNELLNLLLTWFYQLYSKNNKYKFVAPLINVKKERKIYKQFKKQFSPFYKNILLT